MSFWERRPDGRSRIFYGWYIVAAVAVIMALSFGSRNAFSVFLKPLSQEFGWTRGAVSFAFTLRVWVYAATAPLFGWLLDRYGPRPLIFFGAVGTAASYYFVATAGSLTELYFYYGVLGGLAFNPLGTWVVSALVVGWFKRLRGAAIGIAQSGMGIGSMIFTPLAGLILEFYGWRVSFTVMAALFVVVLVPLCLTVIRHRPEDLGMTALGETGVQERHRPAAPADSWTFFRAARTLRFWATFVSIGLCGCGMYLMISQQVAFATDIGFKPLQAATILGVVGMTAIAGRVAGGIISDRVGRRLTIGASLVLQSLAVTVCLFMIAGKTATPALLYLYSALMGLGYGAATPIYLALTGDMFGRDNAGSLFGAIGVAGSAGVGLGPFLGGLMFDLTGSYWGAFWLAVGVYAGALAALGLTRQPVTRTEVRNAAV